MKPFIHRLLGFAVGAAIVVAASGAMAADITGAGATFPALIYQKWAEAYKAKTGIGLNYQPIGSGGGIAQIKAKTVDFGASDKPLTPGELGAAGLTQFPTVIGAVVPVVNIPGIKAGDMVLDGKTLAQICLGKITSWDDAAIKKLNPSLNLPRPRSSGRAGSEARATRASPIWSSRRVDRSVMSNLPTPSKTTSHGSA